MRRRLIGGIGLCMLTRPWQTADSRRFSAWRSAVEATIEQ